MATQDCRQSSDGSARPWCSWPLGLRFARSPSGTTTGSYIALGRPGLHPALPGRPVARDRRRATTPARRSYGALSIVSILAVLAHPGGRQLPGRAAEQALGPDRQPGVQPVGADAQGAAGPRRAGQDHGVRSGGRASIGSATGSRNTRYQSKQLYGRVRRHRPPAGARQGRQRADRRHDGARVQGPRRAHHRRSRSRTSPTRSSRRPPARSARSTSRRATARRTRPAASAPATARSPGAEARQLRVEKLVLAQTPAVPDGATAVVVAGPRTDFFPPEIDALKRTWPRAASCW